MKIAFIVECGPQGAETQVIPFLARQLCPDIEVDVIPLDNKPRLIQQSGDWAGGLLEKGFDRVLIIWDLYPAWREARIKPCRREDRQAIYLALENAGIKKTEIESKIALVCIQEELEAWLIADGHALSAVLSTVVHPAKVRHVRNPEQMKNPKKVLNRKFQEHLGRPYSDRLHAIQIIRALPDYNRLLRLTTFARFCQKLGCMETG
jgi:hypothetical protein